MYRYNRWQTRWGMFTEYSRLDISAETDKVLMEVHRNFQTRANKASHMMEFKFLLLPSAISMRQVVICTAW
jgi:hypothetical protein